MHGLVHDEPSAPPLSVMPSSRHPYQDRAASPSDPYPELATSDDEIVISYSVDRWDVGHSIAWDKKHEDMGVYGARFLRARVQPAIYIDRPLCATLRCRRAADH